MESKPISLTLHLRIGIVLVLSAFVVSCGTTATTPEPTSDLPNGYHYAETEPNAQGWIAILEVQVESGELIRVSFDEVKREGNKVLVRKSDDPRYAAQWAEDSGGVDQFRVYPAIEQEFQSTGDPNISAISGATATVERMRQLAQDVVDGVAAEVTLQDGLHRVELQPDSNGYQSVLEVRVVAGRLLKVSYKSVYSQHWAERGSVETETEEDPFSVYARIEARLRATAHPNALAGISGEHRSLENARVLSRALFEN